MQRFELSSSMIRSADCLVRAGSCFEMYCDIGQVCTKFSSVYEGCTIWKQLIHLDSVKPAVLLLGCIFQIVKERLACSLVILVVA
jgi:hypothetical protein